MTNEQRIIMELAKRFGKTHNFRNKPTAWAHLTRSCQTDGHRYNEQSICVVCGCGMRDVTPPDQGAT